MSTTIVGQPSKLNWICHLSLGMSTRYAWFHSQTATPTKHNSIFEFPPLFLGCSTVRISNVILKFCACALNFRLNIAIKSVLAFWKRCGIDARCGKNYKLVFHQNSLHFFFSLSNEKKTGLRLELLPRRVINFRFVFLWVFLALTCRVKGCLPVCQSSSHNIIYLTKFCSNTWRIIHTVTFVSQWSCGASKISTRLFLFILYKLLSTSRCANKFRMLLLAVRFRCYSFSSCLRCSYQRRFFFIFCLFTKPRASSWARQLDCSLHKTAAIDGVYGEVSGR